MSLLMTDPLKITSAISDAAESVMCNIVSVLNETWPCQTWVLLRRMPSSWLVTHVNDETHRLAPGDVIQDNADGEFQFGQGVVNLYTMQQVDVLRPLSDTRSIEVMGSIFHRIVNEDGSIFGGIWGSSRRRLSHAKFAAMPMLGLLAEMIMMNHALGARATEASSRVVQAESDASTDPLTGLLNLRGWSGRVRQEVARCARLKSPLSLLVLDINGFKQVNDMYGHAKGNELLQLCATVLRSSVREHDVVARLGGDEFAILACDTDLDASHKMAKGLVDILQKNGISCSIGSSMVGEDTSWGAAMEQADMQMYEHKKSCKNRRAKRKAGQSRHMRHVPLD